MREKFEAVVWRNAKGSHDVVMYYQCENGTFKTIFDADKKACTDAAYLQRKSQLHDMNDIFNCCTFVLYDCEKKSFPTKTDIARETTVAISGASELDKNDLVSFLTCIFNAVNNLDIQGSLTIFFEGQRTEIKCKDDIYALMGCQSLDSKGAPILNDWSLSFLFI